MRENQSRLLYNKPYTMSIPSEKKKNPAKKIVFVIILCVALFFGFKKISYSLTHETTDNAQIETQIVPIVTRTSGYVKSLYVSDFDSVYAGQCMAEIDDEELQQQLLEMEADSIQTIADIANASAALKSAKTSLSVNRGSIEISNVKLQQSLNDFIRNKKLLADNAITQKQFDDSKYYYESSLKMYENYQNELSGAQSKIPVLEASVKKNEAMLLNKKAKINECRLKLSYTKMYAPLSGKIGKKNITVGQYVQAGTPLFSIVNDSSFWVTANFKENQIKHLFSGKQVLIRIDAFPDEKITGTIESISDATGAKFALLPPDNSSGNFVKVTQRIPVKIKIDNLGKIKPYLRAGLSVFVSAEIN